MKRLAINYSGSSAPGIGDYTVAEIFLPVPQDGITVAKVGFIAQGLRVGQTTLDDTEVAWLDKHEEEIVKALEELNASGTTLNASEEHKSRYRLAFDAYDRLLTRYCRECSIQDT